MKNLTRLCLLAVGAAALSLNVPRSFGQPFSATDVANNRAIAASPRALEQFPWLARQTAIPVVPANAADSRTALTEVKKNRALAASPRMKEVFPELARPDMSSSEATDATRTGINLLTEVRRNSALAASPRMKEIFPELARGAENSFEVAPLK